MRGRVAALALAAALAGPVPAALAGQQVAESGQVRAELSFTETGDVHVEDLKLSIVRAGQPLYAEPVSVRDCEDPYCMLGRGRDRRSVEVRDLDGDAEPEVIVDLFTGGAHCCLVSQILRFDGTGYRATEQRWGDPGYELVDLVGDARPEFRTADGRFAYAFASYAYSGMPIRVLAYEAGRFTNRTAAARGAVRRDARRLMRAYRRARRDGGETLGLLAAWVADQHTLRRGRVANRFLRRELRAGRLLGDPGGAGYIRQLQRRLRVWGYR